MALRSKLYRCNLCVFTGPQTTGVVSRWTKNLEEIGERTVFNGELVELFVRIEREIIPEDDTGIRLRFDILEEDFLLTGGRDDFVVSLVGEGAEQPEADFPSADRLIDYVIVGEGENFHSAVQRFKNEHPSDFNDFILILETSFDPPSYYLVTWWQAEFVSDVAGNPEFYFIVNINNEFDDQSETTLELTSIPAERDQEIPSAVAGQLSTDLEGLSLPSSESATSISGRETSEAVAEAIENMVPRRVSQEPRSVSGLLQSGLPTEEEVEEETLPQPRHQWYWEARPSGPVENDRVINGQGPLHNQLVAYLPGPRFVHINTPRYVKAYHFVRAIRWGFLLFGRYSFVIVEASPRNGETAYYVFRLDADVQSSQISASEPYIFVRGSPVYTTRIRYLNEWYSSAGRGYIYRIFYTTDDSRIGPGRYYFDDNGRIRNSHRISREFDIQIRDWDAPEAQIPQAIAAPLLFSRIDQLIAQNRDEDASELLSELDVNAFATINAIKRGEYVDLLIRVWTFRAQEETVIEIMKSITQREEMEDVVGELDRNERFMQLLLDMRKLWSMLIALGENLGQTVQINFQEILYDALITELTKFKISGPSGVPIDILEVRIDPETGEISFDLSLFQEAQTAAMGFLNFLEDAWEAIEIIFTKPDDVIQAIGQLMKLAYMMELARPQWALIVPEEHAEAQAYVNVVINSIADSIVKGFKGMVLLNEIAGGNRVINQVGDRLKWALIWEALSWFIGVGEISAALRVLGTVKKVRALARIGRIVRGPIRLAKFDRLALLISRAQVAEQIDMLRYISYLPESEIRRFDTLLESVPTAELIGTRRLQSLDDLIARHPQLADALEDIRPRLNMLSKLERKFRLHVGDETIELSDNAIEAFQIMTTHPNLSTGQLDNLINAIPQSQVEPFMRAMLSLDDVNLLDNLELDFLVNLANHPQVTSFLLEQGRELNLFVRMLSRSGNDMRVMEQNIDALEFLQRRVGQNSGSAGVDDLLQRLRANDSAAWDEMLDARRTSDSLRDIRGMSSYERSYIGDTAYDFLRANTQTEANNALQQLRQRMMNRGVPPALADRIVDRLEGYRFVRQLDLDSHVSGWTTAQQRIIDSIDGDGWAVIRSTARDHAQNYRAAAASGNTTGMNRAIDTAKGNLAEEIFFTSSDFRRALARARQQAALEGIPPESIRLVRNSRTSTGGELGDGLLVSTVNVTPPPRIRVFAVFESKSPSNWRDLRFQFTTDWDRFRGELGDVTIDGVTYSNLSNPLTNEIRIFSDTSSRTEWFAIIPTRNTDGSLVNITAQMLSEMTISGARPVTIFRHILDDSTLREIMRRILEII